MSSILYRTSTEKGKCYLSFNDKELQIKRKIRRDRLYNCCVLSLAYISLKVKLEDEKKKQTQIVDFVMHSKCALVF